ncbi:dienelactone hydrolase family protein [Solemya pervernicosa gill symbiont]|uniref:dienelactone hydrolase family protein n=1 Tax=Solemya pervernicosa gill symbiont TaxID=642797 RepID=UPI00108358B5|nr:dienelactone hydrolase family protein [Solemya pervernicosa gill symbiont]
MKQLLILLTLFAATLHNVEAAFVGEEIQYSSGDTVMKGYLAYDNEVKDKRPGILVVHEWWGHNEYARKRARMLAEMGYVALFYVVRSRSQLRIYRRRRLSRTNRLRFAIHGGQRMRENFPVN